MNREEYYKALEEKYKKTDWSNRQSVKEYNEYARQLRKLLNEED